MAVAIICLATVSCNNSTSETVISAQDSIPQSSENIIQKSITDDAGKTLEMTFDNNKGIVVIRFEGETSELTQQRMGSGIRYQNDRFELLGKGNDITLIKDGKTVFVHEDQKVEVKAKSKDGSVLNMTFNNTDGTVKAYLNGGDEIDLKEQKSASGIWYTNDHYELRGKGDSYELKKDGSTIFNNFSN